MEVMGQTSMEAETRPAPILLRIGYWACVAIAVAVVLRRVTALSLPPGAGPPELVGLDRTFAAHTTLTLAHILPALLFVTLTPFALFWRAGWAERLLYPTGAVVGATAFAMSVHSVGGWLERSAVLFFNTLFLYSLWRSFRERTSWNRRRWLVRAIVILLGIATTRPVMGIFFATSPVTHLRPAQFFGIAFWVGFSINWLVVERWLARKRTG